MLTFIELCSGLGGMRIAMQSLGHKCLGYCECEKPNIEIYKLIHSTENLWFSNDVQKIDPKEVPEVDCYCISCPYFVKEGFNSIIESKKPKFVLMEGDSAHHCRVLLENMGYYFEIEESKKGWKWAYAIAQRDTKIKILPFGIDDYIVDDNWEKKGFPVEMFEKIKDFDYVKHDSNAIIRLTQIKAFTEIAKRLGFLGGNYETY